MTRTARQTSAAKRRIRLAVDLAALALVATGGALAYDAWQVEESTPITPPIQQPVNPNPPAPEVPAHQEVSI